MKLCYVSNLLKLMYALHFSILSIGQLAANQGDRPVPVGARVGVKRGYGTGLELGLR